MITIDGSMGEGGGQVLRTALSLSAVTGQPFRIEKIRANRKKPGLMRQHLTCVQAAVAVCGGHAEGADIGASALTFTPGDLVSGNFAFSVGTAGSSNLVFQTILPALISGDAPSTVHLTGGTHNPTAPCYHTLAEGFLPLLAQMGVQVEPELERHGFYPAGGGTWSAAVQPSDDFMALDHVERGDLVDLSIEAMVANLPGDIAKRELKVMKQKLALSEGDVELRTPDAAGPGNAVLVRMKFENGCEVFAGYGQPRKSAEAVAEDLAKEVKTFLKSGAAVGPHLADQLLLPMAMGAGGRFTTQEPTLHFTTNVEVIQMFLDVEINTEQLGRDLYRVQVGG